jgi:glycosyltransferase involved in cell wall biosynthesis
MPTLHVVMPVYDEGPTLAEIVRRVLRQPLPAGWALDLTMVDDGSRPAAAALAAECAASHGDRVRLIVHPRNRGKGAALMTGFDAVLARAAANDAVLVQDADLEYDPADYGPLLDTLADPSVGAAFGNRWGGSERRAGYRRLHAMANGLLTAASNRATGLGVHDMECCYKLLRVPVLRAARPWLSEERFGIEPQIAAALARARVRVAEVPVRYAPRTFAEGKKIRWTDGVRALWVIARERARRSPPAGSVTVARTDRGAGT